MTSSLPRLVRMLSAGFSNQDQAFENPPIYAHILVKLPPRCSSWLRAPCYWSSRTRSLPPLLTGSGCCGLRAEDGSLRIHNHALQDEQRFWGAVEDPEQAMSSIQAADLLLLEGCTYVVREQGDGFTGEVEPGCRCLVERKGTTAYLVSSFELDGQSMRTIDRGHDPATHDQLWGSLAGPFEFQRTDDFSAEIPGAWLERWAS
jgi:hypothetical protein